MHLPELGLQFIYGRLGWGVVLAMLLIALLPRKFSVSRPMVAGVLLGMIALQLLPATASPAYWLGLAMQWPGALLVGMSIAKLSAGLQAARQPSLMTPAVAALIASFGALLYLDAIGIVSLGWYYWGFGPWAAPLIALALAAGSAVAIVRGALRPQACALLFAVLCFALLRLPTGNIWDALLDPLLWAWSLMALGRHAWRTRGANTAPAAAPC